MCFSSPNTPQSSDDVIDPGPPPRRRAVTFSDTPKTSKPKSQNLGTSVMKNPQAGCYNNTQHKLKKATTLTTTRGDNSKQNQAQRKEKTSSKPPRIDTKICQSDITFQDEGSLSVPGMVGGRSPFPTTEQLRSVVGTPGTYVWQ